MLLLRPFSSDKFDQWNKFVSESNNGTFFHRLDFLSYHKDKYFGEVHNLMWLKNGNLFAILPLVLISGQGNLEAVSPYGASFGGIVTGKVLNYSESCEIADTLINHLTAMGVNRIRMTLTPGFYHTEESDTLFFVFLERGFRIINSDISSAIPLFAPAGYKTYYQRKEKDILRKSKRTESLKVVSRRNSPVEDFWQVVEATFEKHRSKPTHTFQEWKYLCESFPGIFRNDVAYYNEKPVAGIGQIKLNRKVVLSFYLCSDPEYYYLQPLTLLISQAIVSAKDESFMWLDMGTSSYEMKGRDNIFRFKESFGAYGFFRHTIELTI